MGSVLPRFGLYFGMNVCENCQFVIGYISISCDSVTHWLSDRPGTRDAYASNKDIELKIPDFSETLNTNILAWTL